MASVALRESAILAPDGRPVLIATEPAYRSGGAGRRWAGLQAELNLGPNAALLPYLDTMRARSRALYRNNPIIWSAIERLVANLVGWGITPRSQHATASVRTQLDDTWSDWAEQTKVDALQKRAARECMLAGEVFLRFRPRFPVDRDSLGRRLVVPLELQLIEAEHCPSWYERNLDDGGYVRAGIEFDQIGRRRAYWMYPDHPGDGYYIKGQTLVPVPALEVLHLFDPDSPEAIRGTPRLARTILPADKLDAFHDATLERQLIAALFAGFIKRPEQGGILGETDANPEPVLEPGTLSYLADGEDITFPNPPDVGANYAAFVKAMHLALSLGLGLTYEQTTNDLSGVNYSSIRAGSLEFRRQCATWQYTVFKPEFLTPIWVYFLRRAQLAGAIAIPDLLRNEMRAGRVEWITQGWEWVDPLKEVEAAIKSVQAGFETRRSVNASRGNDPGRVIRERAAELAEAKQLGLQFSTDVPDPTAAAKAEAQAAAAPAAMPGGGRAA